MRFKKDRGGNRKWKRFCRQLQRIRERDFDNFSSYRGTRAAYLIRNNSLVHQLIRGFSQLGNAMRRAADVTNRMIRDGEVFFEPIPIAEPKDIEFTATYTDFSKQVIDQCYRGLNIPREFLQPGRIVEPDQVRSPTGTESSDLTSGSTK